MVNEDFHIENLDDQFPNDNDEHLFMVSDKAEVLGPYTSEEAWHGALTNAKHYLTHTHGASNVFVVTAKNQVQAIKKLRRHGDL